MDIPTPPQAVAAVAAFVRERLNDVSDTLTPLWTRRDNGADKAQRAAEQLDAALLAAARQFAMVIVGATAPFAPTSYSRARLIRQMHASGLLSDEHVGRAELLLQLEAADGHSAETAPADLLFADSVSADLRGPTGAPQRS